ncbi:MAG: type I 3-dehydroquinate dehydratase, partial [Pseudomonadota bacterium]
MESRKVHGIMFCIPIMAENTEEALEKMAEAGRLGSADVFEIRLDLMAAFDLPRILKAASRPVLVTYRSGPEGGKGSADPETRAARILEALREGAQLVDVELSLPAPWREKVMEAGKTSEIVISVHDHEGTPDTAELERLLEDCVATGGDIIKIVTTANTWTDNFRILELIPGARERGQKIVAF